MPSALLCPMCGAPLAFGFSDCIYCGVHFESPTGTINQKEEDSQSIQSPESWKQHLDPWYGFRVAHPPGWWVNARPGSVAIREDPPGISSAMVMTYPNDKNLSAQEFIQVFLKDIRSRLPDYTAWEVPGNTDQPDRLAICNRTTYLDVPLAGYSDISVQKGSILVSGFACPVNYINQREGTFRSILASFQPSRRIERVMHREPSEDAYAIWAPPGWQADVQLNRQNINFMGTMRFVVQREPQGYAQASLPDVRWSFSEAMSWMASGAKPVMAYMPADLFCQNFIAPRVEQQCQEMKIECIVDRPDLVFSQQLDLRKAGLDPSGYEISCAYMDIVYRENDRQLRQRGYVSVMRLPMMMIGREWVASLTSVLRAPIEEWDALLPILTGILDSNQLNPTWKAREDGRRYRHLAASAADRLTRQQQINQTLSETSDMMYQSYENRNRTMDGVMHDYSNATLGYQDMSDPTGSTYNVPSGYDQYWLDNTDTLVVGNWLANPDPTWRKLGMQFDSFS